MCVETLLNFSWPVFAIIFTFWGSKKPTFFRMAGWKPIKNLIGKKECSLSHQYSLKSQPLPVWVFGFRWGLGLERLDNDLRVKGGLPNKVSPDVHVCLAGSAGDELRSKGALFLKTLYEILCQTDMACVFVTCWWKKNSAGKKTYLLAWTNLFSGFKTIVLFVAKNYRRNQAARKGFTP